MIEKLKQAKNVITFLLGILSALKNLIKLVESEEPDDNVKRGEKKKEIVMELIMLIYDTVEDLVGELPVKRKVVLGFVDKAIDVVVTLLNVMNVFR